MLPKRRIHTTPRRKGVELFVPKNSFRKYPKPEPGSLQWELIDSILHPENRPREEHPVTSMLRQRYPEVPDPHKETWFRSDDIAQKNDERAMATNHLVSLMEFAISACRQLKEQTTPMTPKLLSSYTRPLGKVIHSAHTLLETLEAKYPLPTNNAYSRLLEDEDLAQIAPKLLLNTQEQVIIWTKTLPAKNAKAYGLLLYEFEAFLHKHILAHFTDWHCDFIHVHPATSLQGVRDVDNYPYKPIIDALSRALFAPDSYDHFSYAAFNYPCDNITAGCYIHITKRSQKVSFFQNFENLVISLQ